MVTIAETATKAKRDLWVDPWTQDEIDIMTSAFIKLERRHKQIIWSCVGLVPASLFIMLFPFCWGSPEPLIALLPLSAIALAMFVVAIAGQHFGEPLTKGWKRRGFGFDGLSLFGSSDNDHVYLKPASSPELVYLADIVQKPIMISLGIRRYLHHIKKHGRKITSIEVHFLRALDEFSVIRNKYEAAKAIVEDAALSALASDTRKDMAGATQ